MSSIHLATNSYTYHQLAGEAGIAPDDYWPQAVRQAAAAGLDGWEPGVCSPEEAGVQGRLAKAAGLAMRSLYVGGVRLHEADSAPEGIERIVACAEVARGFGTCIIVTNPDPLPAPAAATTADRPGEVHERMLEAARRSAGKNDRQLRQQAAALGEAGRRLRRMGMTLAYHWHEPEFHHGAREAHHMLQANDPADLALCLDVHWTWRACGGSNVAVGCILAAYASRIATLHLRQSVGGVWSETCEDGDVDYAPVAAAVAGRDVLLVLEQAREPGTPRTMTTETAVPRSAAWVRRTFAQIGGRS
jgi:inosose dehydratase